MTFKIAHGYTDIITFVRPFFIHYKHPLPLRDNIAAAKLQFFIPTIALCGVCDLI